MATRRYVFIADGDVFMQIAFDDEGPHPRSAAWAAGLSSDPKVIEVTNQPNVVPGWTWDGTDFKAPE